MYIGEKGRKAYQESNPRPDEHKVWTAEQIKQENERKHPEPNDRIKWLTKPANRFEQIWGVIYFYQPEVWLTMHPTLALTMALESVMKDMFISGDVHGYRAFVIRRAMQSLRNPGYIDFHADPWEMNDEN